MKRSTTLLTLVFSALVTLSAFAGDPGKASEVKLLPAETGSIKVLYVNNVEKEIQVKIFGQEGQLVLKDKVRLSKSDNGFLKLYNFEKLEAGNYEIQISDECTVTTFKVTYQNNQTVWANYWNGMMPANEGLASN